MLFALGLAALTLLPQSADSSRRAAPGWIGVSLEVEAERDHPLRVNGISDDSPAQRVGLRAGDRLLTLDGHSLEGYEGLLAVLTELGAGHQAELGLRRVIEVELDRRGQGQPEAPRLGVHLGLSSDGEQAQWVVRDVERGWPAARAGLQAGDRLVSIAGREPRSFDDLAEIMARIPAGGELRLEVERVVELRLGARPDENPALAAPGTPSRGRFSLQPDTEQRGEMRLRLQPTPRAEPRETPAPPRFEEQLRSELAGLNQELRSLREELRSLRRELAGLRNRER